MIDPTQESECLFCRIGRSEIQAQEVYRDKLLVAFLDIGPIREGHIQLIPITHYDYFENLPEELACRITSVAQKIAKVQKTLFRVGQVAYLYTGGDIPHAHAHLVPMVDKTDITSRRYILEESLTFSAIDNPGEFALAETARKISDELRNY